MGAAGIAGVACACVFAAICGFCLWRSYERWAQVRRHRASIVGDDGAGGGDAGGVARHGRGASLGDRVLLYMERLTRKAALSKARPALPALLGAGKGTEEAVRLAGLEGRVGLQAFGEARVRLGCAGAAAGFVLGLLFSAPLAAALAVGGAAFGFQLPGRALRMRAKERACEAERHLPEMLDVVALGMRSGLPFDASLRIYASHFDTLLARELECARIQWSSGLARRDEALRAVARTYDSVVLGRVVETVIKSIRYGSSMVASLESDAAEARAAYQAQREERIAKAPVKMMVPTGVLILPAMLTMVLGPVLLELVQGGF